MTTNIYDMADTWTAGATTYSAIKMNVTDTASAADSLLLDLLVGGSSMFNVGKTGNVSIANDILLSSGSIINFNSGDVTLTHSANTLTMAGGDLTVSVGFITASRIVVSSDLLVVPASIGATQGIAFSGGGFISGDSSGNIAVLNNAQAGFGLLKFGGTTSSFPALKRSSTELQVRLADDSAYATLGAGGLNLSSGSIISFDSGDVTITHGANLLTVAGGQITFAPTTTSYAAFNLPTGTAPSAPVDGDVWREDNTNTGLKIRVNGVTKTITLS